MSNENLEAMSDEDFLNQVAAADGEASVAGSETPEEPQVAEAGGSSTPADSAGEPGASEAEAVTDPEDLPAQPADGTVSQEAPPSSPEPGDAVLPADADGQGHEAASADDLSHHTTPPQSEAAPAAAQVDFEAAYKQIMAPFKANGRDFQPATPEEAVRLMQMGANYTKKMQSLAPNLKTMRMLENHGLLDEQKLSYLIDLDRKDPAAIAKLLKDAKIDPMDFDPASAPDYTPGNHAVSDQEHDFRNALDDALSTESGKETVAMIHKDWDQASKDVLFQQPQLFQAIETQRANGIYDTISAEIDRQKTLGHLNNVPFIQAYQAVGEQLQQQGRLTPAAAVKTAPLAPLPLETRPAAPKPVPGNADKAKAAGMTRTAPKAPPKEFNPLAMTDEEVLAATQTRF